MSIFLPRGQRQCHYCGRRAGLDHLCDEPGPSLHGTTGAVEITDGVWQLPDGRYAVAPEALAGFGFDSAAIERVLEHCHDAAGLPGFPDRKEHRVACDRLRAATALLRIRAWEARLGEQIILDDVVEEGRAA